ncbi:MAG: hypothetical protein J5699_07855 [Bacteroidales bacterium]|nr:hypothetical protein [Bacteroidales bacterium]
MKKIRAIIEKGSDGLFAVRSNNKIGKSYPGGFGESVEEAKADFLESLDEAKAEAIRGGFSVDEPFDIYYSFERLSFSARRMKWIIALSFIVFLHCRILGLIPLLLSVIGYRNYNRLTEEGTRRSQLFMKWALITLIVSSAIVIFLLLFITSQLLIH